MIPMVSIVILNWNGEKFLHECLESVFNLTYRLVEVIVVDNGSTDSSVDIVRRFPKAILVETGSNLGYAAGNNRGLKIAKGEYVATLNNDMVVDTNWLNDPVAVLANNPDIGIIGCRQMGYFDHSVIDGLYQVPHNHLGFFPAGRGEKLESCGRFSRCGYTVGAHGGSAIYRACMLRQLEGLDENFFAYCEEVDLCIRAFVRGWKCYFVPTAIVYHRGSASFRKESESYKYYLDRNRWLVIYKNFPWRYVAAKMVYLIIYEMRQIRAYVFKFKNISLYLKTRKDAYVMARKYKAERKLNCALFTPEKWRRFNFFIKNEMDIVNSADPSGFTIPNLPKPHVKQVS